MLSRRDLLLVQPWEERRYKDHRSKVARAAAAVDARAPAPRPHVALKLKRWQRERERAARVARDNFSLLQRLAAVVRARRLDDRWSPPPPNFQRRVGRPRPAPARPPPAPRPPAAARCFACEMRKMEAAERLAYH